MSRERCPHCGEPLVSTKAGDTCSKCGATIVEKEAHANPIDDDHEMEIEDEKMVVPPERY